MTLPFSSTPYRIQKALTQTPEFVYVGKEFTTLTHFCQNTKKKNKDEQSKTDDFHKENKIVENQNFLEASLIACIFKYIQNKLIELNSTKTRVFDVRYGVVDGKTHISIILPSTERSAIKLAVRIMVKALSNKIVKLTQDNIKVTDPESYRVYKQVVKDCIIKRL